VKVRRNVTVELVVDEETEKRLRQLMRPLIEAMERG